MFPDIFINTVELSAPSVRTFIQGWVELAKPNNSGGGRFRKPATRLGCQV